MSPVSAPTAPGRLNEPVQPTAMGGSLTALDAWTAGRRAELADPQGAGIVGGGDFRPAEHDLDVEVDSLAGEPSQVVPRQINQPPPLVFAKGHFHIYEAL